MHVPAVRLDKAIDVTGAGDSFNAGLIKGVIAKYPLGESVAYGCAVAAAKISRDELPLLP